MSTLSFTQDTNLDVLQEPGCPLSCKDNSQPLLSFRGAAAACNFEESVPEWCSAVNGLGPDERKSLTVTAHCGRVMT
jgi:hypothetical protein